MADKFVAKWFPERHQLVLANIAMWVGLYGVFKMAKGNPKPPKPQKLQKGAPVSQASVSSMSPEGGFRGPTLETFDQWAENPDNWKKWEEWISTPGNLEKWEKDFSARHAAA